MANSVTINTIEGDDIVNAAEEAVGMVISGSFDAGAGNSIVDIVVVINGVTYDTTTIPAVTATFDAGTGTYLWSLTLPTGTLGDGAYSADVTGVSSAGMTNSVLPFTVDTMAPTSLTITTPIEVDDIVNGVEVTDVLVEGTTEAGAFVEVTFDDGTNPVVTVTVQADGTTGVWTLSGNEANISGLDDGPITITAVATDAAGNASSPVSTNVTLDSSTATPTIVTPIEGDGLVNTAEATDVFVEGTAEANASVEVTFDDMTNPSVSVTVTADGSGNWNLTGNEADISGLDDGNITISVVATDTAGNVSSPASETVTLDTAAPTVTSITRMSNPEDTNADTLTFEVTFNEAVANVDATDFESAALTGETISVSGSGSTYVVTVTGGNLANFNGTVDLAIAGGQDITDTAGNALTNTTPTVSNETYAVDNVAPNAPTSVTLDSDTGISGTDLITNNGTLVVTPDELGGTIEYSTDGGSTWSTTDPASGLADGTHTIDVRQVDAAGNEGATASITYTLDTTITTPTVAFQNDGGDMVYNGSEPIEVVVGGIDADASGSLTIMSAGGGSVTVAVASPGATVTLNPTQMAMLSDGALTASITSTDAAGNTANDSANSFSLDTSADDLGDLAVVIDDVDGFINGSEVSMVDFTVSGLDSDATAVVTFTDGTNSETANIAGNGSQTAIDLSALNQGNITVSISATDTAGNTANGLGDASTIDTIAPADVTGSNNINEYTEDATPAPFAPGTGDVLATFPASDSGTTLTYSFGASGDLGGAVELDGNVLRVIDADFFDFEDNPSTDINIDITDAAGNVTNSVYTITLTDQNDLVVVDQSQPDLNPALVEGVDGTATDMTIDAYPAGGTDGEASGSFIFTDDEIGDSHTVGVTNVSTNAPGGTFIGTFLAGLSDPAAGDGQDL